MSFTDSELQTRIQGLKRRFEEMDSNHGPSSLASIECGNQNISERYAIIRLAILSHLLRTLENALEQISICFEISEFMFFYQDDIVKNAEFWQEERGVNQMLCANNFKMALADMQSAGSKLNAEIALLQSEQGSNQSAVQAALKIVERYKGLVGLFHEASYFLTEKEGREKNHLPMYDEDQRPDTQAETPETYLKILHLKSSRNAAKAIVLNIDLAESMFESIMLAKVFLDSGLQGVGEELALVLSRFEALEDARDNRYGFTQIRFE